MWLVIFDGCSAIAAIDLSCAVGRKLVGQLPFNRSESAAAEWQSAFLIR